MATPQPEPFGRARQALATYTSDLTSDDLRRLFTRDTPDAYQFFARSIDRSALEALSGPQRLFAHLKLVFWAFALKLSPARRVVYALSLVTMLLGLAQLFDGFRLFRVPVGGGLAWLYVPLLSWPDGTYWLVAAIVLTNLLMLLEVADRLSLKDDLDVAREIQLAMLPHATLRAPGIEAFGRTRPANTVGGDFYDILPTTDRRLVIALGDVAGKGSPAALLMALLLAMLRTLQDEGLEPATLVERLNRQICRHAPPSRFITLFFGVYEPPSGRLRYVNAGHMPALVRRGNGLVERLGTGGVALGLFEGSVYAAAETMLAPGESVTLYSDGITEAEDRSGRPFEEAGLEAVLHQHANDAAAQVVEAVFGAVERHTGGQRFADDLTILTLRHVPSGKSQRQHVQ